MAEVLNVVTEIRHRIERYQKAEAKTGLSKRSLKKTCAMLWYESDSQSAEQTSNPFWESAMEKQEQAMFEAI